MSRFNIGDVVYVLPRDEIVSQFVGVRWLPSGCYFDPKMEVFCDTIRIIKNVFCENRYVLEGAEGWCFTDEMIEIADSAVCARDLQIGFDDLMN